MWLYDVIFLTPLLAVGVLAVRHRAGHAPGGELPKIVATLILGVLFNVFLIRGNLDSRLPDVIVPAAVLWAWMAGVVVGAGRPDWGRRQGRLLPPTRTTTRTRPPARAARVARTGAAIIGLLAVWLCVDAYARSVIHLEGTELFSSPRRAAGRLLGTIRSLRGDPLEYFAPAGSRGLAALTRYVNRCTKPSDYLLVLGYQPEIYFYANRRIGGGNAYYHANLASEPEQQQTIVTRLQRQRVPIVILPVNEVKEFEASYPIVKRFIDERYVLATESGFGEERPFGVLVYRQAVGSHMDEECGLPCFRDGGIGPPEGGHYGTTLPARRSVRL